MASLLPAASKYLLAAALLLGAGTPGGVAEEQAKVRKEEDEKLLQAVVLPIDPRRGPDEQYYQRFVFRTQQGQAFVGAYWREQGSYVQIAVDIFAVEKTSKGIVGRRIHTESLGGEILAFHVRDLDEDGHDDLLLVHRTGGQVATTGVTLLRQTRAGFSQAFHEIGSDVLAYRERDQVRIMIKGRASQKVWEYSWNASKKTFEVTRTFELLY